MKTPRMIAVVMLALLLPSTGSSFAHPANDTWVYHGPSCENGTNVPVNDITFLGGADGLVAAATDVGLILMAAGNHPCDFSGVLGGVVTHVASNTQGQEWRLHGQNRIWVVYKQEGSTYLRMSDKLGTSWYGPGNLSGLTVNSLTTYPGEFNKVYIGVDGGILYADGDGSTTLLLENQTGLTDTNVKDVAVRDESGAALYAATPSGIFRRGPGASSWTPTAVTQSVTTLATSTTKIYGGGPGGVYYSSNGSDWTTETDLTGITEIAAHRRSGNPDLAYAVNSLGVWRTSDGGANWSAYIDGLPPAEGLGTINTIDAFDTDVGVGIGTENSGFYDRILDRTASPPTFNKPTTRYQKKKSFQVAWSADDAGGSGVANYDISYFKVSSLGGVGPVRVWKNNTLATSGNFSGMPGNLYCFQGSTTDNVGNVSDTAEGPCTVVPLNDTQLNRTSNWDQRSSSGAYLGDVSRATQKGATLSKTVRADRLGLVVTKCPTCGSVKVVFGGEVLGKLSLSAPSVQKKQIISFDTSINTAVVKIVVTSRGKPVLIEGLGVVPT